MRASSWCLAAGRRLSVTIIEIAFDFASCRGQDELDVRSRLDAVGVGGCDSGEDRTSPAPARGALAGPCLGGRS